MKKLILLLLISTLSNSFIFSQKSAEIIFNHEITNKNPKKIVVIKNNGNYIFQLYNKENKNIQSCKWKIKLKKEQVNKLIIAIENSINNDKNNHENYLYKINRQKNTIKLTFIKSVCDTEHKLYYFQKDCNREFILKMSVSEFEKLISNLKNN